MSQNNLSRNCVYSLIENEDEQDISNTRNRYVSESMGRKMDKFLLLLWKNWILQYRRPLQTVIEVLAPVIFSIVLVIIRSLVDPELHQAVVYNPFCTLPLTIPGFCEGLPINTSSYRQILRKIQNFDDEEDTNSPENYFKNFTLIYSPQNDELKRIMQPFKLAFGNVQELEDSAAMERYYVTYGRNFTFAGIQFNDDLKNKTSIGEKINITFRFPGELRFGSDFFAELNNWRTYLVFPIFQAAGPRFPSSITGGDPNYYKEGFLALQHLISTFITLHKKGIVFPESDNPLDWLSVVQEIQNIKMPFINMRRFPYAEWYEDILLVPLKGFVGIIIMLSFVYTCINTVKAITAEKEKQLKESMKIMGLPSWLHWTAWFLKTLSYLLISIILIVALLKIKWYRNTSYTVFTYANYQVMILFLFFYMCATITFCFAISVFFSRANTAATIAGLAWFLSYTPYFFLQQTYDNLSLSTKLISSLGSNTAMAFGFQIMLMFEGSGEGVQWSNIWRPNTPDDSLTLGIVMLMLIFDAIVYLLIALYVEAIFPGDYGVPQPWYFPFTYSFWGGKSKFKVTNLGDEAASTVNADEKEFFEVEPRTLTAGIKIKKLRKVFGNKVAVRNLSLNMYQGQITVLLGHNGAGKTTTMSMLTGMFPPTSGNAIIGGYDILTEMDAIRDSLGLCPQHNILFDDFTVAEHLYFFSRLKGINKENIPAEIDKYIELLELKDKRNVKSSKLSGGMKRKLCVGIALCGNSKVVMLDEPTAGMDPSARRALWDLLLKQKTGRTILLTTHFMDEADLLGDRIAIMAGGNLQCCGSSFFLKKKYGAGYHLVMDKSSQCNSNKVTEILRKYIPNIEIHSDIGSELTYLLAESQSYIFEVMLLELEQQSKTLGVNSYGISLTTLEEVFMKVGADYGQEEIYNGVHPSKRDNEKSLPSDKQTTGNVGVSIRSITHSELLLNQFFAMSLKKILSTVRSWILLVIQIIMPVIFLVIAIVAVRQRNRFGNLPSMFLNLNRFEKPVVLMDGIGNDKGYAQIYKDIIGTRLHQVDSINYTVLSLTADTPITVRRHYVGGVSFNTMNKASNLSQIFDVNLTAYFNGDPYHAAPISLGIALNAQHRKVLNCTDCGFTYVNHPMPYSAETRMNQLLSGNNLGFQLAFNITFSMAFVSSFYILFIVRERITNSKHLQFVSGVKIYIFWFVTLLWDFLTYMCTVLALVLTLVAFQQDGFKTLEDIARILLILTYFGWSALPMMYFAGFLFDVPSTGYTRMTLFSIFTGVAAFMIVQVLGAPGLDLEYVGNTLHWIFLIVPHYSLATGIRDVYILYFSNNMCNTYYETCKQTCPNCTKQDCFNFLPTVKQFCEGIDNHYYKWKAPGIGRNLLYSFSLGAFLLVALFIVEYKIFSKVVYRIKQHCFPKGFVPVFDEDNDVLNEKQKIQNSSSLELLENYSLVIKDLTKYYKNFLAVNGLCLGVKKYECFGLLGINGAGKTTTFKMLTGEVKISEGDAWINGKSIKHDIKEVQKYIGYCPQFDALLDDMTARETLVMFSLLRGILYENCNAVAEKLAAEFDYKRHLDKKVKELSGGNKRKLSTSIALIGNPPVIYLDEPTTGMDPATKRYLWNALCRVRDNGKTIILTSHSMEECEALCTRLAIMVNGNFKCLGSTQHLKHKFAEGYTITIKVKKQQESAMQSYFNTEQIERFIEENFPGSVLREKHEELLNYYVTDKSVSWSKMFGILEKGKRRDSLNIEDYSLGQSSLEQVFLTFTKYQV